jgi:adenosylcobinamide-phosphate guanylyltransferase
VDALVMCGGPGSRLDAGEKPLYEVGGRAMIERVLDALAESGVDRTYAAVSPHTPRTGERLADRVPVVDTPGEGYVPDLGVALEAVGRPALTVAADLPLLAGDPLDRVLDAHAEAGPVQVCVPAALKRQLGASVDTARTVDGRELAPTGLNTVADGDDRTVVSHDARLAVNVNRPGDAAVAEALVGGRDGS